MKTVRPYYPVIVFAWRRVHAVAQLIRIASMGCCGKGRRGSIRPWLLIAAASCFLAGSAGRAQEFLPEQEPTTARDPILDIISDDPVASSFSRQLKLLEQRIDELDTARMAHEEATRTIIDRTFSQRGANINDNVVFGGTLETTTAWSEDFEGVAESASALTGAEIDFEILVNPWTLGSIIFAYEDGLNVLFPTTEGDTAFVDRVNVDTAFLTVGDPQRCPIYVTLGRVVVPFGISTGAAKGDVLNVESPLTVEIFETKEDAIVLGFELPTPMPRPAPTSLPPAPPKVKPKLFAPFVSQLSSHWCRGIRCALPTRPPPPPTPVPPPPPVIPFNGAIYFYNGNTINGTEDHIEHIGGTLGYRAEGKFPYTVPVLFPVPDSPWTFQTNVDFNSSVFDSLFLEFEYRAFLEQIGYVPGMSANIKSTFGPFSLIAEWNEALDDATFADDLGTDIVIKPSAWQVSMGYQFDWNPRVVEIGAQGTYFAIGYSESDEMAGVTQLIDAVPTRVGFVPQKRFSVGVGEWVLDGLRVAFEYSHIVDYELADGGTGNSAKAFFGQVTYEW